MRKDGFVMARRAGTAEYMAPEIELATGDVAYSTAVDVYALGVLLQQIFGFRGFADTIDKEKFNKLAQQFHPRTLSQLTQAETNKLYGHPL
jgi:serine/threonine protein kinase